MHSENIFFLANHIYIGNISLHFYSSCFNSSDFFGGNALKIIKWANNLSETCASLSFKLYVLQSALIACIRWPE